MQGMGPYPLGKGKKKKKKKKRGAAKSTVPRGCLVTCHRRALREQSPIDGIVAGGPKYRTKGCGKKSCGRAEE